MVQGITLLPGDPEQAKIDAEFGRALAKGPKGIVFKVSDVPNFRYLSDEPGLDAANNARYHEYVRKLALVGANTINMRSRVDAGLRRLYAVAG